MSKCQNFDNGNGESQNGEHYAQNVATVATPAKKKKVVIPICVFQHCEQSCAENGQSQCAHSCQWGFRFVYLKLRNVCVFVAESCRQLPVRVLIIDLLLRAEVPLWMIKSLDDGIQCCAGMRDANPPQKIINNTVVDIPGGWRKKCCSTITSSDQSTDVNVFKVIQDWVAFSWEIRRNVVECRFHISHGNKSQR